MRIIVVGSHLISGYPSSWDSATPHSKAAAPLTLSTPKFTRHWMLKNLRQCSALPSEASGHFSSTTAKSQGLSIIDCDLANAV
jgi:hypothetical protein